MFHSLSILSYGQAVRNRTTWHLSTPYAINRIYYIHSGSVLHKTTGKLLRPGILYLFPQNLKFELAATDQTQVDHTFLDFTTIPPIFLSDIYELDPVSPTLVSFAARSLIHLVEQYPMHPNLQRPPSYPLVTSYLSSLLREIHTNTPITATTNPIITDALSFIHDHYAEDISVAALAQKVNYDESVFIRRFRQVTGITPYQYIRSLRLSTALALLQVGTLTVSEIASRVGYANIASFSHAFHQVYSIYPTEVTSHTT